MNFTEASLNNVHRHAHRAFVFIMLALLGFFSTFGCRQHRFATLSKKKPQSNPYLSHQFTQQHSKIGWIWPRGNQADGPIPYVPREGDIVFTSSISPKQTFEYLAIGRIGLPHHVLLVFKKSDGCLATLEVGAGGDRTVSVRSIPIRLNKHKDLYDGSTIAVRQIRRTLSSEESYKLTCFAESQVGKQFSKPISFLPIAIPGRPVSDSTNSQSSWYCSELIVQGLRTSGLFVGVGRPKAIVPEDLYLDRKYDLSHSWLLPQDWTPDQNPKHTRPLFDPEKRSSVLSKG